MLSRYLEVVAGDTLSFRVVLTDGVSPVDVSALEFSGGIKHPSATTTLVNFAFTPGPNPGEVIVTLSPEQTQRLQDTVRLYEWHVRVKYGQYSKTFGFGALKVIRL